MWKDAREALNSEFHCFAGNYGKAPYNATVPLVRLSGVQLTSHRCVL